MSKSFETSRESAQSSSKQCCSVVDFYLHRHLRVSRSSASSCERRFLYLFTNRTLFVSSPKAFMPVINESKIYLECLW